MFQLNPLFRSHAVFAANKPIRIFGEGKGTVTLTFAGQTRTVEADGPWVAEFPPMAYGGPYDLTVSDGGETFAAEDLFVGEVFLMAGQSNMQFKLKDSNFPGEKYASNPAVRLFVAPRLEEGEPYTPADGWILSAPDSIPNWSAIAYHVGHRWAEKGIAVGLIGCYQGASVIESWLPEGTLDALGVRISEGGLCADHSVNRYKEWNSDGALYRRSLGTLLPYALSAVVWYQGESNWYPEESRYYKKELAEMIRVWRKDFADEALPFAIIQIADYANRLGEGWSNIQKAQWEIQSEVSAVKTVISADVSETDDIHPPTKHVLSARVADALDALLG